MNRTSGVERTPYDRVAVVTGAGRGIGRVCATSLVSAGASVVINDVDSEPAEEAVRECLAIRPGSAVASIGSVTDPTYTDQLMKTAVDALGKLDILVNNAGLSRDKMCHLMPDEWWDLVIDVNLTGTFNCIRSAAPYMREVAKRELEELGQPRYNRKIVNFFSTAAIRGNPGSDQLRGRQDGQRRHHACRCPRVGALSRQLQRGCAWLHRDAHDRSQEARRCAWCSRGAATSDAPAYPDGPLWAAARHRQRGAVFCVTAVGLHHGQAINVSGGMQIP
jgi:NAD(P)-dependent dehydrogenase (short-subunit alcohol dehydrogenase family)